MRLRRTILAVVLTVGLIASLAGISAASAGPDATQAKKCKKGYKKNKKGKCVKKKFAPKYGTFKSSDGNTQLRALKKGGKPYVELFRTPTVTLRCTNGLTSQTAANGAVVVVKVKGKSFSGASRLATLNGKFTSTKAMSGTYTFSGSPVPGINCTSDPQSFSATRK